MRTLPCDIDAMDSNQLRAPFPWFGGKSRVAHIVWRAFGNVHSYVEPFFGSGAVLLGRPLPFDGVETINDIDGFVANAWRSLRSKPNETAQWADNPVNENDLHARHVWLLKQRAELVSRLEGDSDYYDPKIAGWWMWGVCCWIGTGWCSGKGPWWPDDESRLARQLPHLGNLGRGVNRQLPHLGNLGQGVNRKLPHPGNLGQGVNRKLPHPGDGQGVNRKLPHLGNGQGVNRKLPHPGDAERTASLVDWFRALSARMSRVRVACGDWSRVCGPSVLRPSGSGYVGVFLDPPYDSAIRCADAYANDSGTVSADVRDWAIEHGEQPELRIALCGYDGEHAMPKSWQCIPWKSHGGYGGQGDGRGRDNATRERIWFSPACLLLSKPGSIKHAFYNQAR